MRKVVSYASLALGFVAAVLFYWSSVSHGCASSDAPQDRFTRVFAGGKGQGHYLAKLQEGTWGDAFRSADFIAVYEGACPYMRSALSVLRDPERDDGDRILAAISMQSLPPADYYEFAENALIEFKQKRVSKYVLSFIFRPYLELTKSQNQWVFWHPRWRRLLREADTQMGDAAFSKAVEKKLRGETFWYWLDGKLDRTRP